MTAPWVPQIHPQVVTGGAAPDPLALLLQSIPQGMEAGQLGYREAQQNSRTSAELEVQKQQNQIRMGELSLAQEHEKTAQANIEHQREITSQQGEGINQFIQALLPQWQMNGSLNGVQPQHLGLPGGGQPQDQFGIPQGLPFGQAAQQPAAFMPGGGGVQAPPQRPLGGPQTAPDAQIPSDPYQALAALHNINPEAVAGALQHVLPIMQAMQPKEVDLGDKIGLMDRAGNIVKTLPKGISPEAQARIDLSKAQMQAMQVYKLGQMGQSAGRQFDNVTKDLRNRAALLQQAVLTVHQAQFATDPEQRRVLASSALANFVQASDQKAQLRYQMLQYFKQNIDPSFKGKFENAVSLLATGQYPNQIYSALENHLNSLAQQSQMEYTKLYQGESKRHPETASYLRTPEEIFTPAAPYSPEQFGTQPPPVP